jgi:hypothetical protein
MEVAMSQALWAVKEKLEDYALARLRLIKAEDDGINGEITEDEFYSIRDAEHAQWQSLVSAIDGVLQRS